MNDQTTAETMAALKPIFDYLLEERGVDLSGYHPAMLVRRIRQRLTAANCRDFNQYLSYVVGNAAEVDNLLDVITINVSRFFRDTLTFELLAHRVLPAIVLEKARLRESSLRVWSAGCAMGEEPYSVAILLHELLHKERLAMNLHIFATDIDTNVLNGAKMAVYPPSSVQNIKYRILSRYFTQTGDGFQLNREIRELVSFSRYDMLDKKHRVPPDSIFGNFDLVLCRNLLIYFNTEYQAAIFAKLRHALAPSGCLVLGQAEAPGIGYQRHFRRVADFSPIYLKR